MLQFICHPAIEHLLINSKEVENCVQLLEKSILISDYIPNSSHELHSGLLEATQFRLFNPSSYIFFVSFFDKEILLSHDKFKILSLTGTVFIRLPFQFENFWQTLIEYQKSELLISKPEWEEFAIRTCKTMIQEKFKIIRHGGELEFISAINMGLRWEVDNCINNSQRIPILIKLLQNIQSDYQNHKEFKNIGALCEVAAGLHDDYIENVSLFIHKMNNIIALTSSHDVDLAKLKVNIKELFSIFETIDKL